MTEQLKDPFDWEGKPFTFVGASDVYSLFDPAKYGLEPVAASTACWKGFVISMSVTNGLLRIDRLEVCDREGHYPAINGVEAYPTDESFGMHVYDDLNLAPGYSGTIMLGAFPDFLGQGHAFLGNRYLYTVELTIENDRVVDCKEQIDEETMKKYDELF
ncbi:MAG: hypothetical protein IJH91_06600 [Mogibacterium sp.]|nr:hypothetical protein [Mogibacterium sp.]